MQILLIDCDSMGFSNLALMKLSAWHKARGDEVFLGQAASWDRSYASCVFSVNSEKDTYPPDAQRGGIGFGLARWLPSEVEHTMPDYGLYGQDLGWSMGFTSRGCIRKCPWCVVPEKEGNITAWAEIYEFWDPRHDRIRLLDNNLLAASNWKDTLASLVKERLLVDFNQGLDIRLVDDERVYFLNKVRRWGSLRFSFDLPGMAARVREGVKQLRNAGIGKIQFYVLVGFNTTFEEDRERFRFIRELNCEAFPMFFTDIDGKEHLPARGHILEREMPRGSRWAIRKYLRLTNRGASQLDGHCPGSASRGR